MITIRATFSRINLPGIERATERAESAILRTGRNVRVGTRDWASDIRPSEEEIFYITLNNAILYMEEHGVHALADSPEQGPHALAWRLARDAARRALYLERNPSAEGVLWMDRTPVLFDKFYEFSGRD